MPPGLSFTFCRLTWAFTMRSPKQPAKLAMLLLLLALLLLCNGVGCVNDTTIHENSVDRKALLDFKKGITDDPQRALSNWTTTAHFCRWNGVICTTTPQYRVSVLNLTAQNLRGQISPSLGNLAFLNLLDLSYNSFVGTFPVLNPLQQLQYLFVNNNNLTGTIPGALANCSKLLSLDFSSNFLVGVIPPELSFLAHINYINFKSNQFEGSIPDDLGKLSNLQSLLLGDNRLSVNSRVPS
uniref:Uncharacterized protein n=1 Tax=Avena sativa TaxID=4498 RepID=A0ACD5V7P6_AVESA